MNAGRCVRIATRKSQLALWQAEHVRERLCLLYPQTRVELVPLSTQGDRILDVPLAKIGGKGLFVKELEQAMLDGRADLAVHSMKDVPMDLPGELALGAILAREDPSDAFVSNTFGDLAALPTGARVGTSSLRRQCQLRAMRPDLDILDLRGNVNTRLARLDAGDFDAVILATAGLLRLGFGERIRQRLPPEVSLPAVGQGAIGIEIRTDDQELRDMLLPLHDMACATCVAAERALNRALEGGCQVPIAGHAQLDERGIGIRLRALVGSVDGARVIRGERAGTVEDAERIGAELAAELRQRGAGEILAALVGRGG